MDRVHHSHAKRTKAKIKFRIKNPLVKMLPLGNSVPNNKIAALPARFMGSILKEAFCRKPTDNNMPQCFERWLQSNTLMNASRWRMVFHHLVLMQLTGIIKQHVVATNEKCALTELDAET